MVLTLDFTAMLSSVEEMMQFSAGRAFALFLGHTHKPSLRHQWLPRTWSWGHFGLVHGGQCKLTRIHPAPPSGDRAQISLIRLICSSSVRIFWHVPHAIPASSATSLIDVGQCKWFLVHMCHGLLGVGGGQPAWVGVVFKGCASTFEMGVPLTCLRST